MPPRKHPPEYLSGDQIREIRERCDWTQRELAAVLAVTTFTISMWECGRRPCEGPAAVLLRALDEGRFAVKKGLDT